MIKTIKSKKLIISFTFIFVISLSSLVFLNTNQAEARHDQSLLACNIRIKKAACVAAVNACAENNHACAERVPENVAISGTRVMEACRTTSNPQRCHQEVVDNCGGRGLNQTQLNNCRTATIERTFSGSAGAPGADATGGAATSPEGFGNNAALAPREGAEKLNPCGAPPNAIYTRFDLGCKGQGNPISDMLFAFVRLLAIGVGIVLSLSIILAGIQYSTSGGSAEETAKAKNRILQAMIALIFYLLISALAQYLIPGGLF